MAFCVRSAWGERACSRLMGMTGWWQPPLTTTRRVRLTAGRVAAPAVPSRGRPWPPSSTPSAAVRIPAAGRHRGRRRRRKPDQSTGRGLVRKACRAQLQVDRLSVLVILGITTLVIRSPRQRERCGSRSESSTRVVGPPSSRRAITRAVPICHVNPPQGNRSNGCPCPQRSMIAGGERSRAAVGPALWQGPGRPPAGGAEGLPQARTEIRESTGEIPPHAHEGVG